MTIETMARISHAGGENPVLKGETLVMLWMRGGYEDPAWIPAAQVRWAHTGSGTDIIAYAVTPERAPSPPAKAPTMDAVEAVALTVRIERIMWRNNMTNAEASAIANDGLFSQPELRAAQAALSAARPFIAAECAKVAEEYIAPSPDLPDDELTNWGRERKKLAAQVATAIKETIR